MTEIKDKNGLTEAQAMEQYRRKNYPKPSVTADIVIFHLHKDMPRILLIQRGNHPFCGKWALPGGFAMAAETLEQSAARELQEETGLSGIPLSLVDVFSQPGRDPRGWTVSAAYWAAVSEAPPSHAGDDAAAARWFSLTREGRHIRLQSGETVLFAEELAFDHGLILRKAMEKAGL